MLSANMVLGAARLGAVFALAVAGSAHGAASVGPMAIAVLEARISGVTCSIFTPDGVTTQSCNNAAWSPALQSGWRAEMAVTIDYHYADDGLSLGWVETGGRPPIGFTMAEGGGAVIFPQYESGALYTRSPSCARQYGCSPAGDYEGGAYPPVFLSNNDFAEDLSGTLTVLSSATANYSGWTPTLYVEIWQTQVNSVAAAVPEPSTWALMLGPLVVLGWLARRRADRSG